MNTKDSPELNDNKVKTKVLKAKIVVYGSADKPYFELEYITLDGKSHAGYGSYKLENVFKWRQENFEFLK